jgi:hypothetical protein
VIDFATLIPIAAYLAVVIVPGLALRRLAGSTDDFSLADLFRSPTDVAWPRGVQEEEFVRWRPEGLRRPARRGATGHDPSAATPGTGVAAPAEPGLSLGAGRC